jgi:CDGSH-type Zn-finger protein
MSDDTQKPTIRPAENGPYIVENLETLSSRDGAIEARPKMALCRCGGSKNKPFCDGTHKTNGFSSAKEEGRVPDKRDDYEGDGITVHDNRGICAHAGFCTDGLPSVFRLREEPFIDPKGASKDEITAQVGKCPSGALSYSVDGTEHRDHDGDPLIFIAPGGPYVIKGGCELADIEFGEGASKEHFDLCRCGGSKNKPFCDGTHWNRKFDEHA